MRTRTDVPIAVAALLLLLAGCDGGSEPGFAGEALEAGKRAERLQQQLSDSRSQAATLRGELSRTREGLSAERRRSEGLRRQLEAARSEVLDARGEADSLALDFAVAGAVAFAAALSAVLLLGLLGRQVRARRALARLLRWAKERGRP
jgi:hypothetical protein